MRNALLFTFILLLLAGLGTFAWVSNNPESPQLERAQDWPLVGGLARIIREAYLGQRTADDPDPAGDLGEATQVDVQSVGRDLAEDAGPMEIPDLTSEETKVVRTPEEQKAHDALIARLKRQAAGQPVDRNDDAEPIGGSSVPCGERRQSARAAADSRPCGPGANCPRSPAGDGRKSGGGFFLDIR